MTNSNVASQVKQFLKNDVYTVLVAVAVAFLLASVPMAAFSAEAAGGSEIQDIQQAEATVNINHADAAAIADGLNGIGIKKAEAIVAWRNKHGQFTHVNQLIEIKGIGEKTLAKNRGVIAL